MSGLRPVEEKMFESDEEQPEQEIEFYEIYIRVDSKTLPSYLKEILD